MYKLMSKDYFKDSYLPIKVYAYDFREFSLEDLNYQIVNDKYYKIPSFQNIKNKITNIDNFKSSYVVLAVTKKYNYLPIKNIRISTINKQFSIIKEEHKSPLEFSYEAHSLDIYPLDSKLDVSTVIH